MKCGIHVLRIPDLSMRSTDRRPSHIDGKELYNMGSMVRHTGDRESGRSSSFIRSELLRVCRIRPARIGCMIIFGSA